MTRNGYLSAVLVLFGWASYCEAGGGVLLSEDSCIITIGFYTAHFTAYQPDSSGDKQFCEDLDNVGKTIFVLDYLHKSLSEVAVDFRIIHNVTDKGEFVQIEDIIEIADIDLHTVFYQPPIIKSNASYMVSHNFKETGEYVGIVTAGHPTKTTIYSSVFPFRVGTNYIPWSLLSFVMLLLILGSYLYYMSKVR
ncbi:MAG: hypothetical protein VYC67_03375 [Pseudomonadota bacterium]|nr:hypothetical protein [Pseudomonadota bacterium]